MGQALEDSYTPENHLQVASTISITELGDLLTRRLLWYQNHVLRGQHIRPTTIAQLCSLDWELKKRNILYLSVRELVDSGVYKAFEFDRQKLQERFADLHKTGLLVRSTREAYNSRRLVIIWGLTGKGKGLLREYYDWIGGKHDAKIGF